MTRLLTVHRAGPGLTIQDLGRSGTLAFGLSRGGAADRQALAEGAALLQQSPACAALEMVGTGGRFEVSEATRIALTGAPMAASLDGQRLTWNASHVLPPRAMFEIGPVHAGVYGYLHVGGGVDTQPVLGSRSTHLAAGLGDRMEAGACLPLGADPGGVSGQMLDVDSRFEGGLVRIVAGLQSHLFSDQQRARFQATRFRRDTRGNRMGVRLLNEGDGFHTDLGLRIVSDVIVPGDIQITGDGTPFVLLAESQTTGGYPRIGSVIPTDLPRVAQAGPGAELWFQFIPLDEAVDIEHKAAKARQSLGSACRPLVRDPHAIKDLLSYQLVSGVTAGREEDKAS